MQGLRKLVNRPRLDDWSPLAKFYYADEALNFVSNELDSVDGRRNPERCNQLVNKLRQCQDRVLQIITEMLVAVFPREMDRASRDYRVKFPDDIVHDNLPGQLWFGAECLTAGSNIIDHEFESEAIRPMARSLASHLSRLREILRDQSLRNSAVYPDKVRSSLRHFDHLFAEFEFNYVSAMVHVKSVKEYNSQLDVAVLFSESLQRALFQDYITLIQIENCDPNVMITLPRLAIVCGLLIFPDGALKIDGSSDDMPEMFRPFQTLLTKIRDLLLILDENELKKLENGLCTGERLAVEPKSAYTMSEFRTQIGSEKAIPAEEMDGSFLVEKPRDKSAKSGGPKNSRLRSRFRSSEDLVHRLFVCIAGVADQLQTNYPSDLRRVLKLVLQPVDFVPIFEVDGRTATNADHEEETGMEMQESLLMPSFIGNKQLPHVTRIDNRTVPHCPFPLIGVPWVSDSEVSQCTSCSVPFTFVRRRHHCRNCGRIFCSNCSAKSLRLPQLNYQRKVRVCNLCFMYALNPFSSASDESADQ